MDDLISRQAAIDAIRELEKISNGWDYDVLDADLTYEVLMEIPVVQPKPEKDRQESKDYCAECDHVEMCSWYPHDGCEFRETKTKQKTGRWIYTNTIGGMRYYGCTICANQEKDCIADEHEIQWYNYCPNCGAKMEAEE